MIRVCKPDAPAKLKAGLAFTQRDCAAYDASRADYLNGAKRFEFKHTIYGQKTVKDALKKAQHRKCCYCEGRFEAHDYGDVEHYRPKGAVKQSKNARALYPGYYWLVYSWENLYYSCRICNSRKSSLFPLADPEKRACSHADALVDEQPLILDPGGAEEPRKHIKFHAELATGETKAGQMTIELVDLNRSELREARLTHLVSIRRLLEIAELFEGNPDPQRAQVLKDCRSEIDEAVEPTAKYSAMAVDFFSAASSIDAPQDTTD